VVIGWRPLIACSGTGEILWLQDRSQMVVVSYPKRVIQGVNWMAVTSIRMEWGPTDGRSVLHVAQE
jgi:hypothetical protein